ncbi:hypothetical protein ASG31_13460 [Chryseobacterium sp. Leaf404]|uniref:hypothetical protein n=1 Tax=unclassified Chryseobacterium TaxID=2593645 RepID=UPI0006F54A60|nr:MULTISPECIES: hypothetical protein [unclassified Chryseobacterium]KQT16513.1 hypothetical protein ASG31_13460 [Chryseobacterium sp. Leaf404]
MKKYIIVSLSLISGLAFAQITIGKTVPNANPANTSVSVEFGNATGGNKGIVLPWVSSGADVVSANPTTLALGTFIFDSTEQKVKYRRTVTVPTTATVWEDLSAGAYRPVTASLPDANQESAAAKAVIGSLASNPATNTTPGIVVLSDDTKAMILPRVNSHNDIPSPSAGMMVYVTSTNQLAVFNGREWAFWTKP